MRDYSEPVRSSLFNRPGIILAWIGAALTLPLLHAPALASAAELPPLSWTPGQTVVSIEFDDGVSNQFIARPLLASHKMKATFFINSGTLINSYHMTLGQIHELYADGNEIGGHTLDHPHLTQLSTEEATREICNDRVNLLNQGFQTTDFAYPYGDYNSTIASLPKHCGYNSARWILGIRSPSCRQESTCPFAESIPPANPYLTRSPQNVLVTDTLGNIEGYVTQAQQHGGGWVQLVFHHICNQCETYAVTESDFSALLNWLATAQNTTVATVQKVIGGSVQGAVNGPASVNLAGPNLLRNPSLEESLYNDGFGLVDDGLIPPPSNLLQNLSLENLAPNGSEPICWSRVARPGLTGTWANTAEDHSGNNAERATISAYSSGDMKLISQQDATLANPTLSSATASATGGRLAAAAYYYEITATTAYGETVPSNEVGASTAGASGSVALSWPAVKGATGYRIYRAGASGQETPLAGVGAVTSYTDSGSSAPGTTTPPSSNTASKVIPCAPAAVVGHAYQVSAWYKTSAGAGVRFVIYYRDQLGNWIFWKAGPLPASMTWTQGSVTTAAVPTGATALGVGISLMSVGTLDADDLSLGELAAAGPESLTPPVPAPVVSRTPTGPG
jgi:peptidoglycan/xylan/chitin deacetylase (PgdA/CDA1 family)